MFIHDTIKIEYIRQGYLPDFPYHLISDREMFDAFIVDELKIAQEDAYKVKQGQSTLWDSPKTYLNLYKLSSFEFTREGNQQILVMRGSRSKLAEFNTLLNLNCECYLSPYCYFAANYPLLFDSLQSEYNKLVDALYYHIDTHLNSVGTTDVVAIPDWVYSYMNGSVIGPMSSELDIHELLHLMNLDSITAEFTKEVCESCLDISSKWVKKLPPSKNTMRPPSIYGELHVIKSLRIAGLLPDDTN